MSIPDDILAMTDGGPDALQEVATAAPAPPSLPPLTISALMVTKTDLIVALRAYLPHLSDIETIDDGDRFLLSVGSHEPGSSENGASGWPIAPARTFRPDSATSPSAPRSASARPLPSGFGSK